MGDYLLVSDYKSPDKLVYIFDKNNFKYITSTGDRGQGPGEISNMGRIATNEAEQIFLPDRSRQ
ncbi:MAG: 6-bladed beta-propeller [Parabacteroides sp.]